MDTNSLQSINQRDYYRVTGSVINPAGSFDARRRLVHDLRERARHDIRTTALGQAIRYALATTAALAALPALPRTAATPPTNLDRIEITGSRIRQVDETAQPVFAISRPTSSSRASARSPTSCRTSPRWAARRSAAQRADRR
jgi:hypothetical protein